MFTVYPSKRRVHLCLGGSTVSLNGATLLGIMSNESIFLGDCKEIFTFEGEV